MLYLALSLFVLCEAVLGSKRLLQQFQPPFQLPTTTNGNFGPLPGLRYRPSTTFGLPNFPGVTRPRSTIRPNNPQSTVYINPDPTMPLTTAPGVGIVLPGNGGLTPPVIEQECLLPYTDPNSCAGRSHLIKPKLPNYKLKCDGMGTCAQSQFLFSFDERAREPMNIEAIVFDGQYAGFNSLIILDNPSVMTTPKLEMMECKTIGSCNGVTLILKNADLGDLECSQQSYCENCWVKTSALDPAPKACWGW